MATTKIKFPAYFATINVYRRTKVFVRDDFYKIIISSFLFSEKKYNIKISNYVIMPDHIHFIFYFKEQKEKIIKKERIGLRGKYQSLSTEKIDDFIKNFKKYTAHEIIDILKKEKSELLSRLVLKKEKKRKHWFALWLDDKHIVIINNKKIFKEKQRYILDNPIKAKLVRNVTDYKYIK